MTMNPVYVATNLLLDICMGKCVCINKHFYFNHNISETNLYAASECKFCSTNQNFTYVGQHQKRVHSSLLLCIATMCKICIPFEAHQKHLPCLAYDSCRVTSNPRTLHADIDRRVDKVAFEEMYAFLCGD